MNGCALKLLKHALTRQVHTIAQQDNLRKQLNLQNFKCFTVPLLTSCLRLDMYPAFMYTCLQTRQELHHFQPARLMRCPT